MREKTVTLRLTDEEYCKLSSYANNTGMSVSQYIRSLIDNTTPNLRVGTAQTMEKICRLYIMLTEQKLNENESIMKGVNELCQTLL